MRRSWLTLVTLAACVAALALFVWFKPPQQDAVTVAVSTIEPAQARSLRVLRRGKLIAALEKRDGVWTMTEPLKAPAEAFQVDRLLAVLQAKAGATYAPSALEKFELDKPLAELVINDQRIAFGGINTVTREQYVLTQNQVLPLELRFGAALPNDAMALVRRSLFAPNDAPQRFEFGAFTVAYDGKKWITTPSTAEASQDDFNRWVSQWREGSALRVERMDPRAGGKDVVVTLKGGDKVALGVVKTETEWVVRRADLGLQFVFVDDIGKQMMAPPIVR